MQRSRLLSCMVVAIVILFLFSSTKVHGAGGYFGVQERIKCLQPLAEPGDQAAPKPVAIIRDLNQPKYSLCYKYGILFFFAGVYLHDDGYVLAERDDDYKYVPLDAAKIAELQEKGLLPKQLPSYSIPLLQYAVGYSLWLFLTVFLGGTFLWRGFKRWKNKGKYCLKCELTLIDDDIKKGVCGNCGEPVPVA